MEILVGVLLPCAMEAPPSVLRPSTEVREIMMLKNKEYENRITTIGITAFN